MGFCLECGEVTAQQLCFECFSRFDILEADAEFEEYQLYIMKSTRLDKKSTRLDNESSTGDEEE